jgi:acetyl-CoA carboxylase carboxyltransferase component
MLALDAFLAAELHGEASTLSDFVDLGLPAHYQRVLRFPGRSARGENAASWIRGNLGRNDSSSQQIVDNLSFLTFTSGPFGPKKMGFDGASLRCRIACRPMWRPGGSKGKRLMAFENRISEHERRRTKAIGMGGPEKLAHLKETGRLNARERIDYLCDPGTFLESGMFATSDRADAKDNTPADGKVCGYGRIRGREAAIVSHDITVKGASSSPINVKKMGQMRRAAKANGMPLVLLNESSGARIPDTMGAVGTGTLGQDPQQFVRMREIPYVAAVLGPAFGTACWFTMLSDYVVMRKDAILAISSPKVTSIAINQQIDPQELGGWRMQTEVTGQVDHAVDTDEEALDHLKRFLSYLPSHNKEMPPRADVPAGSDEAAGKMLDILPEDRSRVYDMRKVVAAIADPGSVLPLKERYGKTAITALARINGRTVGVVASNPLFKAGALDPDSCDKITGFLVLCDSFNIPIIILVDTPGFLIGVEGERRKAPGKIMNFMTALQMCTVPKFSIVLRKSYGQAYLNMGGTRNTDEMAAWYTADVGFMDPVVGVNVVYGVRQDTEPERFGELRTAIERDSSAYDLAGIYSAQAVIDPRESRNYLARLLEVHSRRPTNGIGQHLLGGWPTTF